MINIRRKTIYLVILLFLSLFGVLMIYSSSSIWALYKTGNKYYYLIRQSIFLVLGFIVFLISSKIPYKFWLKHSNKLLFLSLALLILVLIPGIGIERGGARSWIGILEFSIQPSEIAKIALIIFTAKFLSHNQGIMKHNKYFYLYMLFVGFIFGLIILEPDFGSGIIMVSSIVLMLFIDGIKMKNIIIGVILCIIMVIVMVILAPYRLERINAFLDPWSDPLGSGFQTIQSLYAISPASLFGYGLFNSIQKYFYLPEPQTDFIFAIIVEEFGIIGGCFIIFLFLILIYYGFKLSKDLKDPFASYLVFGFTGLLLVQVFTNIAVVIGLIPVTGVTLPLISYGGSSLVITLFMFGIIYNIMNNKNINYLF